MIKKEIYPKTQRIICEGAKIQITEKLDGSNLVIFKTEEGKLGIAQRNNIFEVDELIDNSDRLYKGLLAWILEHKDELQDELYEGSAICGEWLGMGKLKYDVGEFDKRFYMFAKARITDEFELTNIIYDHDLFIYPFNSQTIPSFIGIVPIVSEINNIPNKKQLDSLYEKYTEKVNRNVEGFVVNYDNRITKYVRMKNGKLQEHFDRT